MAVTAIVIRDAARGDAKALSRLAAELATSFPFSRAAFDAAFSAVRTAGDTCLLVEEQGGELLGYLLGFDHVTFFANGRVAWVEELMVESGHRRAGIGRALMAEFERRSAARGCKLIALATWRAAPFYRAIGYQESAAYLRKIISALTRE